MGHRVAVLKDGVLQQCDTPQHALPRAGQPVRGRLHRLAGDEPRRGRRRPAAARSATATLRARAAGRGGARRRTGAVTVGFRPEALQVGDGPLRGDRSAPSRTSARRSSSMSTLEHRGEMLPARVEDVAAVPGRAGRQRRPADQRRHAPLRRDGSRIVSTTATLRGHPIAVRNRRRLDRDALNVAWPTSSFSERGSWARPWRSRWPTTAMTCRLVGTHLDREIIDAIRSTGVHPGLGRELPSAVRAHQIEEAEAAFAQAEIVVSGVNSVGVELAAERLAALLRPGPARDRRHQGCARRGERRPAHPPRRARRPGPGRLREQVGWAAIIGPAIAGEVAARRERAWSSAGATRPRRSPRRRLPHRLVPRVDVDRLRRRRDLRRRQELLRAGHRAGRGRPRAPREADSPDRAHNYEAALFAQSAAEIRQWASLLGAQTDTASGCPASATCTSRAPAGATCGSAGCSAAGCASPRRPRGWAIRRSRAPWRSRSSARRSAAHGARRCRTGRLPAHAPPSRGRRAGASADIPWSRFFGGEPRAGA